MDPHSVLPQLLGLAWLAPLASFTLIVLFGPRMGKAGKYAGYLATAAILTSCTLSMIALFGVWLPNYGVGSSQHAPHDGHGDHAAASQVDRKEMIVRGQDPESALHGGHASHAMHSDSHDQEHGAVAPPVVAGDWYVLGQFGSLRFTIGYYIDSLTVMMFAMVTFIATCIHFYANGYMHDELHDVTDHEVTLHDGHHLHRPGRFSRFFQYFSLFCFSMLGIVVAGNILMVFLFWELVGICSYFLIGFYVERKSASNAANKAFIVNRVGDFGMIIGLMALLGSLGTFAFGDVDTNNDGRVTVAERGIFSQIRPPESEHRIVVPEGMVRDSAHVAVREVLLDHAGNPDPSAAQMEIKSRLPEWRSAGHGYWLLIVAGLGIFCGCVGKSAQFPLHVWLPDAMEGPTPVSALVHSATMVAAGVYLTGRFYPVFTPEVLLVIAIIGAITLFIGATIAITATDIKRVLAYSTVSQLGYMMLALGVGGWTAGLFHLVTHAFFKSLLFLCSGSVIHACHTNEMPKMGGLIRKMPYTGYTMLVGCMAIAGVGVPFVIGLSGYYSKDAIIAQAMSFRDVNPLFGWLFYVAAAGAAITAFYMFRLWYMTFAGEPRDHHIYDHAHESPKVMTYPLVVLAVMAVVAGWSFFGFGVTGMLEQARPLGLDSSASGVVMPALLIPAEHESHLPRYHNMATVVAFSTAMCGILFATIFYYWRWLDPAEVRGYFSPLYRVLVGKWYFDELYAAMFVAPVLFVSRRISEFDRRVIDGFIDNLARFVRQISIWDDLIDRYLVDGLVNVVAGWTYSIGLGLRAAQTGRLRQYVLFIVVGTVALFVLVTFLVDYTTVVRR